MAKILTSNVVITRDKSSLDNLFNGETIDFESIDTNKFLVSPKKNKYLVSLEYEINFNSDTHTFLSLTFADFDGRFEIEYLSSTDLMSNLIKSQIEARNFEEIDPEELKLKYRDTIYVCFGNGDKIRNWSDPHKFELREADIDIEKGIRYFKLMYSPSNSSLFRKPIVVDADEINPQREKVPFENATHLLNCKVDVSKDSFSKILEKFFYKYLKDVCETENVVVLIPDGIDEAISALAKKRNELDEEKIFSENFFIDLKNPSKDVGSDVKTDSPIIKTKTTKADYNLENDKLENKDTGKRIASFNQHKFYNKTANTLIDLDLHAPINCLSQGIQKLLKLADADGVIATEETSIKYLKKFVGAGLIKNEDGRCVLLGMSKQISELIYLNNFSISQTPEPTVKLFNESEHKQRLESNSYREAIKSIFRKKKNSSGFEEDINLDEFSFGRSPGQNSNFVIDPVIKQLTKAVRDYEDSDTPVFVHNLKNSNVLSINIENNKNSYLLAIDYAIETDFYNLLIEQANSKYKEREEYKKLKIELNQLVTIISEIINKSKNDKELKDNASRSPLVTEDAEKIKRIMVQNKEDQKDLKKVIKATLKYIESKNSSSPSDQSKQTSTEQDDALVNLIYKLLQNKDYLIYLKDGYGAESEQFRRAAIFKKLYTIGSPNITIKTLPYFNLSDFRTIAYKYAILLSKKTVGQISPNNPNLKDLVNQLDFFSGLYNIVGFRHIINPEEMYSEFKLLKKYVEVI
jgi:hypothetical protein